MKLCSCKILEFTLILILELRKVYTYTCCIFNCFIPTEIPPVNLMVADQCTTIRASWDITEGPCTDLSYNVTLLSSDGVILQGPFTTSDTVYDFTDVETLNGIFNVTVVPINGNVRGASVTEPSNISVSQNGRLYSVY